MFHITLQRKLFNLNIKYTFNTLKSFNKSLLTYFKFTIDEN